LDPGVLWALLAWAALLATAVWSYFRAGRVAFFAAGFTFVTFLPASNFIVTIGTIMGERLFYLPSAGLCLLISAAWDHAALGVRNSEFAKPLRWIGFGVVSAALVLLAARTLVRNRDWVNNSTLMESALRVVPRSAKMNYLVALARRDRGESGLKEFDRAVEIYPDYPVISPGMAKNYGRALLAEGRIEEAIYRLERAVNLNPGVRDGYYYLGAAYLRSGLWKKAEEALRTTVRAVPKHADAYNNLSFVLWKQERYSEALDAAEAALGIRNQFAEAHYNKAVIFESMGRTREAVASYEETLRIKPIASARARMDKLLKTVNRES
jgi:tetratricopeptide (TPR) repeat protein